MSSSTKKTLVIGYLLLGETIASAAKKANVSDRQVFRWMEDETFTTLLHKEERKVMDACSWRLVGEVKASVDALVNVRDFPSQAGAGNKRLAAVALLETTLKYKDVLTFEERLTRLEQLVGRENG